MNFSIKFKINKLKGNLPVDLSMDKTRSSELYQFEVDERGESKQMMSPTEKIVCKERRNKRKIQQEKIIF